MTAGRDKVTAVQLGLRILCQSDVFYHRSPNLCHRYHFRQSGRGYTVDESPR